MKFARTLLALLFVCMFGSLSLCVAADDVDFDETTEQDAKDSDDVSNQVGDLSGEAEETDDEVVVPSDEATQDDVPAADESDAQPTDDTKPEKPKDGAETVKYPVSEIGTQGNWVKKRKWLEQALKINSHIQEALADIQKSRKAFYEKFTGVDKTLDSFYSAQGLEQGKMEALFDDIKSSLEKQKQKDLDRLKKKAEIDEAVSTFYDYKVDEIEDKNAALIKEVEQLKLDINSIDKLDKSLADRLKKVDQNISTAVDDAASARELTDKMWYIIDDQLARTQYYRAKNLSERSKSILNYITVTLKGDFDSVIHRINSQIESVKKGIQSLEGRGIVLQNRTVRLIQKKEQGETDEQDLPRRKHKKKRKPQTKLWYALVLSPFTALSSVVVNMISGLYDMIFGPIKKPKKRKRKKRAAVVEQEMEDVVHDLEEQQEIKEQK